MDVVDERRDDVQRRVSATSRATQAWLGVLKLAYTPRARPGARKKNLTLSAKEYTKPRPSFVRAPLNSRVGTTSFSPKNKGKSKEDSLDHLPLDVQEAMILEDLLFVLMGIEGVHITYHPDYSPEDDDPLQGIRFAIVSPLDPSIHDLVERVLPLATYYTAISAFVESRSHLEFGLVNHALCAAIRDMLKEYQTLLSQLEHAFNTSPQFTLQKLWFYVHPTVHTLSLIYRLILELATMEDDDGSSISSASDDPEQAARDEALGLGGAKLKAVLSEITKSSTSAAIPVKGGEVIYERMQGMSGDPTARKVYGTLMSAAGAPYVEMLREWATTGRLHDPYEELCVKESKFISKGILELRDGSTLSSKRQHAGVPPPRTPGGRLPGGACIPPMLEGWKHKVLLSGKYLNVIRECGIQAQSIQHQRDEAQFSVDDEKLYKFVEDAYTHANRTLLHLLLQDQQLAKSASIVKLQSLLDLSLSSEDASFREDVKVTMASTGLYEWLLKVISEGEGNHDAAAHEEPKKDRDKDRDEKKALLAIDALALDYTVKFPLSLVISRKTILRYQLLFRFLLHLKHVEQSLASIRLPGDDPYPNHPEFEQWRLRVTLLRTRMLSFIQQILAFVTFEVLEPNWRSLEVKLTKVTTVDQLLRDHVDFLDTCLKECMLTITCSTFALYSSSFTKSANQALAAAEAGDGDQAMSKRWEFLKKFESNFNHWFFHLDCVQYYASSENVTLLPLVVRLSGIKTP
ncbi:Spc98 family-domain-containing protein [Pisolithus microcarpus]|nr:Spc98 family-domain-containing protein [Pisolithus microcarpus]